MRLTPLQTRFLDACDGRTLKEVFDLLKVRRQAFLLTYEILRAQGMVELKAVPWKGRFIHLLRVGHAALAEEPRRT